MLKVIDIINKIKNCENNFSFTFLNAPKIFQNYPNLFIFKNPPFALNIDNK